MSELLDVLNNNNEEAFCSLMARFLVKPLNSPFRSLYYVFKDAYHSTHFPVARFGVFLTDEERQAEYDKREVLQKQAQISLCRMMEQWLNSQNSDVKEYIMFSNNQGWGFYLHFLQYAHRPTDLIAQINAAGYLQISYDDDNDKGEHDNTAQYLTSMLRHNLDNCVNAIVAQANVQYLLSKYISDLDGFFDVLLCDEHTNCALHYLECMKHNLAPKWVGQLIAAVLAHANHRVAQWLHDCPEFNNFLQWSDFATVHIPTVSFTDQGLDEVLPLAGYFPTFWHEIAHNSMIQAVATQSKHASHWISYTHKHLTSLQRVKGVQHALHAHFVSAKTQEVYHYSHYGMEYTHLDQLTVFAQPFLDTLTDEDVVLWNSTHWFLNGVYAVDHHPYFVRERMHRSIESCAPDEHRKI